MLTQNLKRGVVRYSENLKLEKQVKNETLGYRNQKQKVSSADFKREVSGGVWPLKKIKRYKHEKLVPRYRNPK